MSANTTTVETPNKPKTAEPIVCGKFSGAFKLFAASWYTLLVFWGLDKTAAHKVCNDCSSSLAQALASGDSELAAKIGKAKKDGETEFRLSGKTGTTKVTDSMSLVRLVQQLEQLRLKEKLILKSLDWQSALPGDEKEGIRAYLTACYDWAQKQTWSEE